MAVEQLQVGELIDRIHNYYLDSIEALKAENAELKYYKTASENEFEQDLILENIQLRKHIEKLEEEMRCWKAYGTPF